MRALDVFASVSRLQWVVSRTPKVSRPTSFSGYVTVSLHRLSRGRVARAIRRRAFLSAMCSGWRTARLLASVVIHKAHDVGGARDPSCLASMPDSQVLLKRWGNYTQDNLVMQEKLAQGDKISPRRCFCGVKGDVRKRAGTRPELTGEAGRAGMTQGLGNKKPAAAGLWCTFFEPSGLTSFGQNTYSYRRFQLHQSTALKQ